MSTVPAEGGRYVVSPDALLSQRAGAWVLSDPRTRRHCELDAAAVASLTGGTGARTEPDWREALASARGWNRTEFTAQHGLWSDPTGFGPRQAEVAGGDLFKLLRKLLLIHAEDGADYRAFLAPLTSVLDRSHLGTFHQLVGQFQALKLKRDDKWRWWHDQKFTPDGMSVKPSPYKFVQERFFDRYFDEQDLPGRRVLDFACGNGFYADKFARLGASVVGVDTSRELIELARMNYPSGPEFHAPADPNESLAVMNALPEESFDLVYMSDVMLFLVETAVAGQDGGDLERLLAAFQRLLKPDGRLQMMEPSGIFWLGGLYGAPEDPYVIVPEYRRSTYNVAPTPDVMIRTINSGGFCLTDLTHPELGDGPDVDPAMRGRAANFPLWDLFTFARR